MGTTVTPEISKHSKYWIDKHRYYELKHFCLQYQSWLKALNSLSGVQTTRLSSMIFYSNRTAESPTERCVIQREFYQSRIDMVNSAAQVAAGQYDIYILEGVLAGRSYDYLKSKHNLPFCKDAYYAMYRKFFWILSGLRE